MRIKDVKTLLAKKMNYTPNNIVAFLVTIFMTYVNKLNPCYLSGQSKSVYVKIFITDHLEFW